MERRIFQAQFSYPQAVAGGLFPCVREEVFQVGTAAPFARNYTREELKTTALTSDELSLKIIVSRMVDRDVVICVKV